MARKRASRVVRVHLGHPSGEFRRAAVAASSPDEAVAIVESQELRRTAYLLDPSEALELERRLRAGQLSGRDRARILTHMQDRPYRVLKAEGS